MNAAIIKQKKLLAACLEKLGQIEAAENGLPFARDRQEWFEKLDTLREQYAEMLSGLFKSVMDDVKLKVI